MSKFGAAAEIFARLVEQNRGHAGWQAALAQVYMRIGLTEARLGNVDAAREVLRASVAIGERLVSLDATNTEWKQDLTAAQGGLLTLQGEAG